MAFSKYNDDCWKGPCYLEEIELALGDIPDSNDIEWIADAMNDDFWLSPGTRSSGSGSDQLGLTREATTAIAGPKQDTREPHDKRPSQQRPDMQVGWLQSPLVDRLSACGTAQSATRHINSDVTGRDTWQPNDSFQNPTYSSFPSASHGLPSGNHLNWPVAPQANDPLARPSQHALLRAPPFEAHGPMSYAPSSELNAALWHVSSTQRPGRVTMEMNETSHATASLPLASHAALPLVSDSDLAGLYNVPSETQSWVDTPSITQFVHSNQETSKKRSKAVASAYVAPLTAYNFFFQFERQRLLAMDAQLDTPLSRLLDQFSPHNADAATDPYAWILRHRVAFQDGMLFNQWSRDPSVKRKHCKSHGRISFVALTCGIARAWRGLDGSVKDVFVEIAARDSHRYQQETKLESTTLPRKRSNISQRGPRG